LPYGAVERLLSCKRTGILTYFQTKVNKKILATKAPRREENLTTEDTDEHGFLILDTRCSMLDARISMLDSRYWILDTGFSILDSRYWILDAGFSMLDAGFSMFAFIRDSHFFCTLPPAIYRWLFLAVPSFTYGFA
jgi:hypothetical protein